VPEKDRSECLAWRRFGAGEQIFIFYGARPNCEFLVHNGFVPALNEHNTLAVRLGISRADPLGDKKRTLLAALNLPNSGEFLLRAGPEPVDLKLTTFLRIFSMNEGDNNYIIKMVNFRLFFSEIGSSIGFFGGPNSSINKLFWPKRFLGFQKQRLSE